MNRKIAVVGGGASGMMAAIQAAASGASVSVYERNDRVGKKILSTGNGKCNFSNEKMDPVYYHGSGTALWEAVYGAFDTAVTKAFFTALGMRIKERDGYLYPASEQASTVLDLLRYELERQHVTIHTGTKIEEIYRKKDKFILQPSKDVYDAVILACGGSAAPATGSDGNGILLAKKLGHTIVPVVPALTALRCQESFFKQVAGVRCDASLSLRIAGKDVCRERGELQLTDYGLSGIPAFQISGQAAYALREKKPVTVRLSFLPDLDESACVSFFQDRLSTHGKDEMDQFLTGVVNKKINRMLLKAVGIKETEQAKAVSPAAMKRLWKLYCGLDVTVTGVNPFEKAQVSAGGVDCGEVTASLMSKKIPELYFAGEILDIDGLCGGYNLQWAWSSGAVAGRAAAAVRDSFAAKSVMSRELRKNEENYDTDS